jgi:molybdate transport system permease protein
VSALRLSLECSLAATAAAVVLGMPLAWIQARTTFPGQRVLRAITTLPIVLPPVVAGVALLVVFGRRGMLGMWLDAWFGLRLPFTVAGAALAETFVAMPFFVLTMEGALRSVDRRLEDAARTLGASRWTVFRRVTLPLVRPSLQAGAVLAWARALGEFGATITFAGNVPGKTQTLPLAVYLALEAEPDAAFLLSLVLLGVSLAVLIGLRRRWLAW